MAILVREGSTTEATYESGVTGQVGTVAVRIDDNEGATVFGPTVIGISELGTTGVYTRVLTAPGIAGTQWTVLWSLDGTFDPETVSIDDLYVIAQNGIDPTPPLVPIETGERGTGPCRAWTSVDDVAACCGDDSDTEVLEDALVAACEVLYLLSNEQYPGACETTVRPCQSSCEGPWATWVGDGWGVDFGVFGTWPRPRSGLSPCGCAPLDRIPLAGHAREVTSVKIDGEVVDAETYRLDENRWLTRVPHPDDPDTPLSWPSCQNLALPDSEDGTFSITYEFGFDPPVSGVLAARELACAIYANCAAGGTPADCALPQQVVRVQRQGITFDLDKFKGLARGRDGWESGLPLVDLFLNAVNPLGQRGGRASVWTPGKRRYPRPVG